VSDDPFKQVTGYTKGELSFALSWAVVAMDEDFIEQQYEDTKDPGCPGEDAERALGVLQDLMERLDVDIETAAMRSFQGMVDDGSALLIEQPVGPVEP
jgi:hypothetical protein